MRRFLSVEQSHPRVLLYVYCRALGNVAAEWKLICSTHNLLKLFRSGWTPQSA